MSRAVIFNFDPEKNKQLIEKRQISFEEIIAILEQEGPLDILAHPNVEKYAHQKVYVVKLQGYVYLVPYVEDRNCIFLKTVYPSRKATKLYLKISTGEKNDF